LKTARSNEDSFGRTPKPGGIDFKKAAIEYPNRLSAERLHHLRTKPFYNLAYKLPKFRGRGLDADTHRQFCDFANMAVALELLPGARLLDVACGSGWLAEFFARLGYDVTGIDISPELIALSEERVRKVAYGVDHETPLRCRFLVHDVENGPLPEVFDAAVCYDAMHHFNDETAAVRHCAAMLKSGGLLFVLEGNRPPPNSAGETELFEVIKRFGTLESPFDPGYLKQLLNESGLAVVGDYVSINTLIDREAVEADGRVRIDLPSVNYLLCKKVTDHADASSVPDSRAPGQLRAELTVQSSWPEQFRPNEIFALSLTIKNVGDTLWLGGRYVRRGAVMLAVQILDLNGLVVDEFHGEPSLPRAVAPGDMSHVTIEHACPSAAGDYILKIDLVDEHVCWFGERGSSILRLPLRVV
jgi:2-polyprenyl-3-methyl-5-hydroxy-6-metoxy-1,4-benzoquinol methylase